MLHQHRVGLADAVGAVLSLREVGRDPVQLSEHNVAAGGQGDAYACCPDVADEDLGLVVVLKGIDSGLPGQ